MYIIYIKKKSSLKAEQKTLTSHLFFSMYNKRNIIILLQNNDNVSDNVG